MKQTVEEAAREFALCQTPDATIRSNIAMEFETGAEWQAKQSPWISVEERLPELNQRVLVAYKGFDRIIINIMKRIAHDTTNPHNPKWHWSALIESERALAWMPIPTFDQIIEANKDVLQRMKEKGGLIYGL